MQSFQEAVQGFTLACNARRGLRNGEQAKGLRELAAAGCHVTVSTLDIEAPDQARQLAALTAKDVPLGGVFHLAMYLDDTLVSNQVRCPATLTYLLAAALPCHSL